MFKLKLIGLSIFVIFLAAACDALQEEGLPTEEARAALEIQIREICQHAEPSVMKKQLERIRNAKGLKVADRWIYREAGAAAGPDIRVFKSGMLFGPLLDDVIEKCQDSRQVLIDQNLERLDNIITRLEVVDESLKVVNGSLGTIDGTLQTANDNLEKIDASVIAENAELAALITANKVILGTIGPAVAAGSAATTAATATAEQSLKRALEQTERNVVREVAKVGNAINSLPSLP